MNNTVSRIISVGCNCFCIVEKGFNVGKSYFYFGKRYVHVWLTVSESRYAYISIHYVILLCFISNEVNRYAFMGSNSASF